MYLWTSVLTANEEGSNPIFVIYLWTCLPNSSAVWSVHALGTQKWTYWAISQISISLRTVQIPLSSFTPWSKKWEPSTVTTSNPNTRTSTSYFFKLPWSRWTVIGALACTETAEKNGVHYQWQFSTNFTAMWEVWQPRIRGIIISNLVRVIPDNDLGYFLCRVTLGVRRYKATS